MVATTKILSIVLTALSVLALSSRFDGLLTHHSSPMRCTPLSVLALSSRFDGRVQELAA